MRYQRLGSSFSRGPALAENQLASGRSLPDFASVSEVFQTLKASIA